MFVRVTNQARSYYGPVLLWHNMALRLQGSQGSEYHWVALSYGLGYYLVSDCCNLLPESFVRAHCPHRKIAQGDRPLLNLVSLDRLDPLRSLTL